MEKVLKSASAGLLSFHVQDETLEATFKVNLTKNVRHLFKYFIISK